MELRYLVDQVRHCFLVEVVAAAGEQAGAELGDDSVIREIQLIIQMLYPN